MNAYVIGLCCFAIPRLFCTRQTLSRHLDFLQTIVPPPI